MSTIIAPTTEAPGKTRKRVEMNWDPITRIVGRLGIFTKIDFDNRQVAECYSTSSIFRGYSIFMKGKDPRDSHFITSRICGICGEITPPAPLTLRTWRSASSRRLWPSGS
jgi:hydrogenase large subunit